MTSSAEVMECQVTVRDCRESDDVVSVQVQRRQVTASLAGCARFTRTGKTKANEIIPRC